MPNLRSAEVQNYPGVTVGPEVTDEVLQSWWLEGFAMAVDDAKLLKMDTVGIRGSPDFLLSPEASIPDYTLKNTSANKTSRQILRDLQLAWNLQQFGIDSDANQSSLAHAGGSEDHDASRAGPTSEEKTSAEAVVSLVTLPGSSESDSDSEDDCAFDNSDPDRIVGDDVTFDDLRQALGDSVNTRGLLVDPVPGAGVAVDGDGSVEFAIEESGMAIDDSNTAVASSSTRGRRSKASTGLDHYVDLPGSPGKPIHVQRLLAQLADVGSISHDRSVRYKQSKSVVCSQLVSTRRSSLLDSSVSV